MSPTPVLTDQPGPEHILDGLNAAEAPGDLAAGAGCEDHPATVRQAQRRQRLAFFSKPGRVCLHLHSAGGAGHLQLSRDAIQIYVPLERAQYRVMRQSASDSNLLCHLSSRDVLVIPASDRHSVLQLQRGELISLSLTDGFMRDTLGQAPPCFQETSSVRDAFISTAALQLRNALRSCASLSTSFAEAVATVITYRVGLASPTAKCIGNQSLAPAFTGGQIQRIEALIDDHLSQEISLAQLAAHSQLSAWHFLRRFQASLGISPHAFITQRRLMRARLLLECSALSISQIALEIGMSHSHFSRSFLHQCGHSPREYRRHRQSAITEQLT
jgi:AraC-like DNA-binding protein